MQYTGNYGLRKPEGTDYVNIDDLNYNADVLDQKLKEVENKADSAPPDSVNDAAIGTRTPDQAQVPASPGMGTLTQLFSWLANRIKAITGKTNWWDAPDTTLAGAKQHIDAAAPHSGHETPAGAQAKVDTHANLTSAHSATSAATASRIMMRDAYGRAKVAAPSASDDIARKQEVDAVQTNLTTHTSRTDNPHSVTKSQVGLGNVDNMSATDIRIDTSKPLRAEVSSSAPSSPANGQIWYDSTNHKFKGYANGAWV